MIYVVYQNTRDVDGYVIKTVDWGFKLEHQAQKYADECERMALYRDSWFTVEEEE